MPYITGASYLLFTIFMNILLDSSFFFKRFLFASVIVPSRLS